MSWVKEVGGQPYILIRFGGEIGVKSSRVRVKYEREVLRGLLRRLKKAKVNYGDPHYLFGRVYLPVEDVEAALKEASKVFGISSASPALRTTSSLEDLVKLGVRVASACLRPRSSFAVKCRRVGEHPYRSPDVVKAVGSAILTNLKELGVRVDLDHPDFVLGIEVREDVSYVYLGEVEGPGGLPAGSQGRVVCLVSGGLDSPVAAWMAMRRGCIPLILHFDLHPFAGPETRDKIMDLAKVLAGWMHGGRLKVYVAKHGKALTEIKEKAPDRLTCILCKRMMYRVAERLALKNGAKGIVTGDIIGEQASQTLANLAVIDPAVTQLPIHRPLLGFTKEEVERLARKIGSYGVSARPEEGCKAIPRRAATRAKLEDVEEAEENLNVEDIIYEEAEGVEEFVVEGG
ncbi:MAG: tRNA 4-thiouridine(8) synthase ThiI [Thermoprotei archaeon]|nr:MAG: tRNA 4-thiouridine(8) synthase ThiI [Thermoprotei archaeon]